MRVLSADQQELMRSFCSLERDEWKSPFLVYNFRGGNRRDFDLIAMSGRVLLCVHEGMMEGAKEHNAPMLRTEHWWALSAIAEGDGGVIEPMTNAEKWSLFPKLRAQVEKLPEIEWLKVSSLWVTTHGRRVTRSLRKMDFQGLAFFRFAWGVGLCVSAPPEQTSEEVAS